MKSEYLQRLCGNFGLKREFVEQTLCPDWWDDTLFDTPSGFAELCILTERILGVPWSRMTTPGDGAAAIAKTALRVFNPPLTAPTYDVPMLGLRNASGNVYAFYQHEDVNAAANARPVYAVVHTHPRLDVDVRTWARTTYLHLPLDMVSREVAAFYHRVSGVSDEA